MKKITKENFEEIKKRKKILVDFNAKWCGPCRMMKPILEEIEQEKRLEIAEIDIDENEELAIKYNISSIPCLILFENGIEKERSIGLKSKETIIEFMGEK